MGKTRTGPHGSPMPRGGFSLAEVLIATAILGVGLLMVIGVFPAAIEQNKDSTGDVIGTMICENAMGVAKTRPEMRHPMGAGFVGTVFDPDKTPLIDGNSGDTRYPAGDANFSRGFIMLARRAGSADRNDYQFLVVSYRKADPNDKVLFKALTATFGDANTTFIATGTSKSWLRIGSPVIDPKTGAYAMIVGADASTGKVNLNHAMGVAVTNPLVVVEADSSDNPIPSTSIPASPATCVLITRTALRQ